MKWIGQHIYDLISRFRSDVYLEDVSTGTIASGGNLGLDSDNKIVKATTASGDITSIVAGTGLSGTSLTGPIPTLNVDASQTQITAVGTIATGTWRGTAVETAYIGDDQITEDKLSNTLLAEIDENSDKVSNVTTNLSQTTGTDNLRINSSDGTNVTIAEASGSIAGLMTVTHHHKLDGIEASATADQSKSDIDGLAITTVGTIDTGVWNGTAIASAYLDADTMHYSAQRQLTHHTIQDDIDTQVVFLSLAEYDGENTVISNNKLPLTAPVAGKLLKVFVRSTANVSGVDFTWKLYTRTSSQSTNGNAAEIGAQTGTGPTNQNMVTYDFTTGLDSGTNVIGAGDKVQISLETDGSTSNSNYFITLLWEWDLS